MEGDDEQPSTSKPDSSNDKSSSSGENYEPNVKSSKMDDEEAGPSSASTSDQSAGPSHISHGDASREQDDEDQNVEAATGGPSIREPTARKRSYRFMNRNYRHSVSSTSSEGDAAAELEAPQENSNRAEEVPEEVSHDSDDDEGFDGPDNLMEMSPLQELSRFNYFFSSSRSGSDMDDDSDSGESYVPEHIIAQIDDLMNKPMPKQNLCVPRSLIYRHHGLTILNRRFVNDTSSRPFRSQFCASLHTVQHLQITHYLSSHYGCVNCVGFSRDGNLLVSGSDDLFIVITKWASRKRVVRCHAGHGDNIFQTRFLDNGINADGVNVVTSSRDGQVRVTRVDPSGGASSRLLYAHTSAINKIALSDSNPFELWSADEDGIVNRYDFRESKHEKVLTWLRDEKKVCLYSIAAHPYDPEFCISGVNRHVNVYDMRKVGEPVKSFVPSGLPFKSADSHITSAVYNHNGTQILASYAKEKIYLFDNRNNKRGEYLHSYYGHKNVATIKGVNFFGPASEYVISGSDCGNLFIWDRNTESIVHWANADSEGVVNCLEPHPSLPVMATSGLDHDVKIWAPTNNRETMSLEGLRRCVKQNITDAGNLSEMNPNMVEYVMETMSRRYNRESYGEESSSDNSTSDEVNGGYDEADMPDQPAGACSQS